MSEMAFARMLLKGEPKERAMLRRAQNEQLFGGWAGGPFCGAPLNALKAGLGWAGLRQTGTEVQVARLLTQTCTHTPTCFAWLQGSSLPPT